LQIGRRIYYEKSTGNVLFDTGERSGNVVPTTIDQDFESYVILAQYNRDAVGVIELEYGQYYDDFLRSSGNVRVNLETGELEFSYPDPSDPEPPAIYRPPLTEEVAELNEQIAALMIDSAAKDGIIADLALQVAELKGVDA